MVTLRCTKRLQKFLGIKPAQELEPSNTVLGDWYGNLIETPGGDVIVFVSDRSLLSVGIPAWEARNLQAILALRVGKLLDLLGINADQAGPELKEFERIQIANTESRSVIGSMNEIVWYYYDFAEDLFKSHREHRLSEAEMNSSEILLTPLKYRYPRDVARDLFQQVKL